MLNFSRSRIIPVIWLLVPTLLWSLFLHNLALCIDPLFFPVIERHVPPKFAFFGRLLWVLVFIITLLLAWNIGPGTYLFYLHLALPSTPKFVLAGLGFAVVLLIWFSCVSDTPQTKRRWHVWAFSVGVILLVAKVLVLMGVIYAPVVHQDIKSPIMGNAHLLLSNVGTNSSKTSVETPENTFYSFIKKQSAPPARVVLMLVESWGEKQDSLAAMAGDIQSQGFQIVKYGFTFYRGSTLSGEFRELCSKYVQPSDELLDEMKNLRCAPQYLYDKGYQVTGVHGYHASFYARSTFWARFGIKNQVFNQSFQDEPQCPGPFPGVCDESLIRKSIDILDSAVKPAFVYILTLSSHEPIDPAAMDHRGKYFNEIKVAHPTQVITRRAISTLLTRLEQHGRPNCTLVYITGDHQPPSASARGGIFEPGKVPYLAFTQHCPAR
jgi:hypothetical protein